MTCDRKINANAPICWVRCIALAAVVLSAGSASAWAQRAFPSPSGATGSATLAELSANRADTLFVAQSTHVGAAANRGLRDPASQMSGVSRGFQNVATTSSLARARATNAMSEPSVAMLEPPASGEFGTDGSWTFITEPFSYGAALTGLVFGFVVFRRLRQRSEWQ